ncbi:COR domain-containing protein [Endothiovibrio diazotrophicus]
MSKEPTPRQPRLDIARERIAAEKVAYTGRLDLANLGLTHPPRELAELEWLEELVLGEALIGHDDLIPNDVHTLITALPPLPRLRLLDCSFSNLADLLSVTTYPSLQQLDCSCSQVSDIEPIARLSALQEFRCWNTEVADLAPIAGLSALQLLDCSNTLVADLAPIAGLSALRELRCWGTPVADLAPIAGLSALQQLDCSHTHVTDLSALSGQTQLRYLDLFGSPIHHLPRPLLDYPTLKKLFADHLPALTEIPAEVLSQHQYDNCLPRVRAHLADLESGAEPQRDQKVIVLGNGRIGKTQFCRRLRGEGFEEEADSTHGITVTSVELSFEDEEPAILNLFDFGGQELYHGTHALFMRTRALFVLLWTPESEEGEHEHGGMVFRNHPLPYWLEYIRHLGGEESPVIVVQNQCDGGRGERANLPVAEEWLRPFEEAGRLFTRVTYSAKDDCGQAQLMDALRRAVADLRERQGRPQIGRNRLAVWERLREWRDRDACEADEGRRNHRLIPYEAFEGLCNEQNVHDPKSFAEVLHRAGMVFHQPNLFNNQLVLDQSWALNHVYSLFTREGGVHDTLRRLGGRFTRTDLHNLLWRRTGLSEQDQKALIGMMTTSGICFVHRHAHDDTETEYVAPDLLPEQEEVTGDLAARWEALGDTPLGATFAYPFLSPAIARTLLSALGKQAADSALYWRYGLCLYDAASHATALVEEIPDEEGYGGRVMVCTKGVGAERLQQNLVEQIAKLNERSQWPGQLLEARGNHPHRHPEEEPAPLEPAPPPVHSPDLPELYVSYAWAREREEPLVADLCTAMERQGLRILRDSEVMRDGERISQFMERLSTGRCVVVVLSAAYLRSEYCMTELYRIYLNARQRGDDFLRRIVPLVQEDLQIDTPKGRIDHAIHWKGEYDTIDALIREHGAGVIGQEDFARFKLMDAFHRHVGDILHQINDFLLTRDHTALARNDFARVKALIDRALA